MALFHDLGFRGFGQKVAALAKGERGERREESENPSPSAVIRGPRPLSSSSRCPAPLSPLSLTSSIRPRRSRRFSPNSGRRSRFRSIPRPPAFGRGGPNWWACRLRGTTARPGICRSGARRAERHLDAAAILAALKPILEDPAGRKDRPEPEVRHDRAPRGGHRIGRRGLRHHGRQLFARSRAAATTTSTSWPKPISSMRRSRFRS